MAGGLLYFTFSAASGQSIDLYATNGTAKGTTLLKDFMTPSSVYPSLSYGYVLSNFTAVGSKLFFGVNDPTDGKSLWVSDGTPAGTTLLQGFGTPASAEAGNSSQIGPPILTATAAGNNLFFTTEPAGYGTADELWKSDGTTAGTIELADVDPANPGGYSGSVIGEGEFAALNGTLYFASDDPTHGVELWQSNGTVAGTGLFLDLNPGTAGSFPGNMTVIGNTLYFSATTAAGSAALWSSDGTVTGTKQVASFGSQPDGTAIFTNIPAAFGVIGNSMIFAANAGSSDSELWKTDGTAAGTSMIKVLAPSQLYYTPSDFTTVGGKVFFVTQTATDTLWVTDGTTAGTTELATFNGTLADLMAFDGKLAFIESSSYRSENSLWLSDGTVSGTTEVTSFPSQNANYAQTPTMAVDDGKLFISAPPLPNPLNAGLATLWVSDGTAAGTMPIPGVPQMANDSAFAVLDGKVYFSEDQPSASILQSSNRAQLWVTDGTAAGTKMVTNVGAANAWIDQLVVAGNNLYIIASQSGSPPDDLYVSNGTAKGTVLIHTFAKSLVNEAAGLSNGDLVFDVGTTSVNPRSG